MDTIVLSKIYPPISPEHEPYKKLPTILQPNGCKAWTKHIKEINRYCCCVKLHFHDITGAVNTTQQAIDQLRRDVDSWLGFVGLTVNDFEISRIDYDYNFYLSADESEVLMDTMQQLPERAMRMDKANFPLSVYYMCKSRHTQVYRKDKERRDKRKPVAPAEQGLCRQEVQCFPEHIKYMLYQNGLTRVWDNWVTIEREGHYLTTAKPIYPNGDFYTLDGASSIIQSSGLTRLNKQKLMDSLLLVQDKGMAELRAKYSLNTVKKYLRQLEALGINPLTIKPNPQGIDFIANPFYAAHAAGGATP